MSSPKGRDLRTQAEHARETEQDFLKALKLTDEALTSYQEDKDYLGVAEVLDGRFITLKHLFRKTKDKVFLVLARHTALIGVEIAEEFGPLKSRTLPYFNLGKAYEELRDFNSAGIYYEKALECPLPAGQDRRAVKADMKAHWAYALYKSGDKNGLCLMMEAIRELEKSEEVKYNKDVWLSGAHMRTAEMLYESDKEKSKLHIDKAKKIIDENTELTLRKEQFEELSANLLF